MKCGEIEFKKKLKNFSFSAPKIYMGSLDFSNGGLSQLFQLLESERDYPVFEVMVSLPRSMVSSLLALPRSCHDLAMILQSSWQRCQVWPFSWQRFHGSKSVFFGNSPVCLPRTIVEILVFGVYKNALRLREVHMID